MDKSSEIYNTSVKSWLQDNDTEMYSKHKEFKSVLSEDLLEP